MIQKNAGFSSVELGAMHRWCEKYRDLVKAGGKPTKQQDRQFLRYSRITYAAGVACGPR